MESENHGEGKNGAKRTAHHSVGGLVLPYFAFRTGGQVSRTQCDGQDFKWGTHLCIFPSRMDLKHKNISIKVRGDKNYMDKNVSLMCCLGQMFLMCKAHLTLNEIAFKSTT